jgi:signal transduction histidine kinase
MMPALEQPIASTTILKDRKVLLVDDDRLNIRILAGILKPEGVTVAEASSGEAALALYSQFRPDLVLLDVMMPGINGFETCRQLKQQYGEECAPVIFITAKNESDDIVEGLVAGGVDYLPKPFRPKEALARIRIHVQNRVLREQQNLLVDQLSQANAAKNRLLGMAAHDLRNPLASIRALAEFLSDGTVGPMSAEQLDLVGTIHNASQSMLTLVNELLDLSVIQSGELKLYRENLPLAPLLRKSVELANLDATPKGTSLTFSEPASSGTVLIDEEKIKQVVANLLSNAVKFSPPGSAIRVSVEEAAGRATVRVRDQGPGIPPGEHGKLFHDFGRTSVKPTGGEKSTGLGLAICKKLIEAHGGTIRADNEPDGGCTFQFSLPLNA